MNAPAPSDEQLRRAWLLCKVRGWPATFEEAMADPVRARLVRACAAGLARKPGHAPAPANFELEPPPGRVRAQA